MSKLYQMKIMISNELVFFDTKVKEEDIAKILLKHIKSKELFPFEVEGDCVENGGSTFISGKENYSYQIARNTSGKEYIEYYFGIEDKKKERL